MEMYLPKKLEDSFRNAEFKLGEVVQLVFLGGDPRIHELLIKPIRVEYATVVGFYAPHNSGCYVFKTDSGMVCHIEPFAYPYQPDGGWGPYGNPQVSGAWEDWFDEEKIPRPLRLCGNFCMAPGGSDPTHLERAEDYRSDDSTDNASTKTFLPKHNADPKFCGAVLVIPEQSLLKPYILEQLSARNRVTQIGPTLADGTAVTSWEQIKEGDVVRMEDSFGDLTDNTVVIKGHKDEYGERWDGHILLVSVEGRVLTVQGKGTDCFLEGGTERIRLGKISSGAIHDVRISVETSAGVLPAVHSHFELADTQAETAALVTGANVYMEIEYFDERRRDYRKARLLRYKVLN